MGNVGFIIKAMFQAMLGTKSQNISACASSIITVFKNISVTFLLTLMTVTSFGLLGTEMVNK